MADPLLTLIERLAITWEDREDGTGQEMVLELTVKARGEAGEPEWPLMLTGVEAVTLMRMLGQSMHYAAKLHAGEHVPGVQMVGGGGDRVTPPEPEPGTVSEEPCGRLEQIGDAMLEAMPAEARAAGVRAVVLVRDEDAGAACAIGYEEGAQEIPVILNDLLGAAGTLSETAGIKMHVFPMAGGEG